MLCAVLWIVVYRAATVRERVAGCVYHRPFSRESTRSLTVAALYAAEEDRSIQFMNNSIEVNHRLWR